MACEPCKKKAQQRAAEEPKRVGYVVKDNTARDRGVCEHGIRPWFNCEVCSQHNGYSFKGNFR